MWRGYARLPAPRNDYAVRGTGCSQGHGDRPMPAAHRHQEYLGFLREIDKNVPPKLEVHVIVDSYATHKHPRLKRWLVARPRFHVHFTPTYVSWLNQVETWFQPDHSASDSARNFPQCEGTGSPDRSVCACRKRYGTSFCLDCHLRQNPATM
jgi:hypothetical protein